MFLVFPCQIHKKMLQEDLETKILTWVTNVKMHRKHSCGFELPAGTYVEADMCMQLTLHMYYKSLYETQ